MDNIQSRWFSFNVYDNKFVVLSSFVKTATGLDECRPNHFVLSQIHLNQWFFFVAILQCREHCSYRGHLPQNRRFFCTDQILNLYLLERVAGVPRALFLKNSYFIWRFYKDFLPISHHFVCSYIKYMTCFTDPVQSCAKHVTRISFQKLTGSAAGFPFHVECSTCN